MSKNSKKIQLTRRQALAIMCATGADVAAHSPIAYFVQTMIDGMINKARAQTAGIAPRRYVYINMSGGPGRWMFDSPINPNGNDTLISNPLVGSKFLFDAGGNVSGTNYEKWLVPGTSFYVSSLWSNTVPTPGGGTTSMASLLPNTIMLRGVDLVIDGHSNNVLRAIRPVPGNPSLDGLVADRSTLPIPAIGFYGSKATAFGSASGVARVYNDGSYGTSLEQLMGPFLKVANSATLNTAVDNQIEAAMSSLAQADDTQIYGAAGIYKDRLNAKNLLKKNFINLAGQFDIIRNKYLDLIKRAMFGTSLPGITDRAVPGSNTNFRFSLSGYASLNNVSYADPIIGNPDLRTLIQANTGIDNLATQLAMVEFLFKNDLSSSAIVSLGGITNISTENSNLPIVDKLTGARTIGALAPNLTNFAPYFDQHTTGAYSSLLLNSLFFRALAACIVELKAALTPNGIFDDTVIQIGGEFARSPDSILNPHGSGHGYKGQTATLISGGIKSFKVVGNIKIGTSTQGTWGQGAPIPEFSNRIASIGNLASSVATLLRVNSPAPNDPSLIAESGGDYVSAVGRPKNVA